MKVIATDVGSPITDIKLRFDLPDIETRVSAAIFTRELSHTEIKDDRGRWWSLTIHPYFTAGRKPGGAVLVFTDIDVTKKHGEHAEEMAEDRRRLLVETEEARAEADAANMAKMVFLSNMSQDLRTPLNTISGYADMMEMGVHGPLTAEQENDLARIKQSARYLLSLIHDILNFAKIETAGLNLHVSAVSISDIVATLEGIAFPHVTAKGLTFESHGCDCIVLADRDKLQQILLALVTKAVKYTTAGAVGIRWTQGDSTVNIDVFDSGAGISAEELDRIFQPSLQKNRTLTDVRHDGAGLGLAMSRNLVRAMGGDIRLVSTVGQGSVFTVTLPRGG